MTNRPTLLSEITLQRHTVKPDSKYNAPVSEWTNLTTVRAHVRDASAGERYRAAQVEAKISVRFTVRSTPTTRDLTPSDRVLYEGVAHNITGLRETIRRQYIEIDAVAIAARGS